MSDGHDRNGTIRALVVDDERNILFVFYHALKCLGERYQIETASRAEEALEKLDQESFQLLITDLKMPGMGGIALTELLREQKAALPIVWITAYSSPFVRRRARELNVFTCLDKPVEVSTIRATALAALMPL